MYKEAAKFLLDVAKLIIGGVFLTSVMGQNIPKGFVFSVGGTLMTGAIIAAFMLFKLDEKKRKIKIKK
jgi:hypothetical protein